MDSLIETLHKAGARPGKDPATVNVISHKDEKLLNHLFKQANLAVASLQAGPCGSHRYVSVTSAGGSQ